ncbi:MAG: ribose 5-phosphate isomerase B [Planctomycetaceae bacterium]|nr:ribose 5-phosphate isomerase B [Planctomycetaceae bacterium]
MKIAVASDHRGVRMKSQVVQKLTELGHSADDCGPGDDAQVDYPDYASQVAGRVARGEVDRGILICGTGMGMCIAANKFRGVRAITCHDEMTAEMSRRHNDANVLCLSADLTSERLLNQMVDKWLNTEFEGGRHARRLSKISDIEQQQCCPE